MWKRYIVEVGTGLDLHGMDVTKAGKKAVKDAVSHGCLCGASEILNISSPDKMKVHIKVAAPFPDQVNVDELASMVPFGSVETEVTEGGLTVQGMAVKSLGEGDTIVMVNVALTVFIDV